MAALGTPQLELGELAGRIDMPIPAIDYEGAKALMLSQHTDVAIARNNVVQAQYLLRLARVTPKPNVNTYVAVQHDDTFVPGGTTVNVQVGGPIPAFNRNRGGIVAAQAQLTQTHAGVTLAENQLVAKLADDFGRYESNRRLTQQFQSEALRDQVRTYRGVYQRYRIDAQGVQFTDVVVAQQTLSTLLTQYVNILAAQWQAVVDVARELQVDDVYQLGELVPVTPLPEIGLPE